MIWWLILLAFGYLIFRMVKTQMYWSDKGVRQGPPIPLFGDMILSTFRLEAFTDGIIRFYKRFPKERYTGLYLMTKPILIIQDIDLIKQITVKDFDHFTDHRQFLPDDVDPLWSNNLFVLKGEPWRDMRSTLSPAFTSSKMRAMFSLMNDCAKQYMDFYTKQNDDVIEVEMKDSFTRFANDVIATCAFGVKCDSLKERDNEFYTNGTEATNFDTFKKNWGILLYLFSPWLSQYSGFRMISKEVEKFFLGIIQETIKVREENDVYRPDMLQLLMQARKGHLQHDEDSHVKDAGFAAVQESEIGKSPKKQTVELTDIKITAQALIFFFAGFDTISTVLSFVSHELAVNPDVQEKLRKEVDEINDECKGNLTYESISKMQYMDMVISEALRKWPAMIAIDRCCVKPYTIEPKHPHESPVHLKKGDLVWVPAWAIHHDPKYYPNPERFDPERFNETNKHNIKPYTYMPFGLGPRNCIGSRFALMEAKIIVFHLLSKFEFTVIGKTSIPMNVSKKSFLVRAENGYWIGLKKRELSG